MRALAAMMYCFGVVQKSSKPGLSHLGATPAVLQKISGRGDAIIESENDLLFISAFSGAYELKLQPPRKRVITADYFWEPRFVRYFLHIGALCV
jgi:hypothetical protein